MTSEREIERLRRAAGAGRRDWAPEAIVPGGIVQFATDPDYLGFDLYPRQGTVLKLITCDLAALTSFDHEVLAEWSGGFVLDGEGADVGYRGERGTTPDVLDRLHWCQAQGRSSFEEVVLVLGRRASKSFLVSIVVAWKLWKLLAMGDPQQQLQMARGKPLVVQVFGTDQAAVRRDAYGDVARILTSAPCFKPFVGMQTSTATTLLTPAQLKAGATPSRDEGSIVVTAAASTLTAGRGPSSPVLWFDEIAHLRGAGSTADSIDVYGATQPATSQFDDSLIVQSSTPWETVGKLYETYCEALEIDPATKRATRPGRLVLQLESPALYVDHDRAGDIPKWPGGPPYPEGLKPKITYQYIERQLEIDPVRARVEWYAQFGTVTNPYLRADRAQGVFGPYRGHVLEQLDEGALAHSYVAHADPSRSNANFGFGIGRLESDDDGYPNVVFALLHAWKPGEFPDGVIDYFAVNDAIYGYVRSFRVTELTFDQYSSVEAIQGLNRRALVDGLEWRPLIYERTATASQNHRAYELFKSAVNAGLVHAPPHDLAMAELTHLIDKDGKVVAPTSGPVRTKDVADVMVNVVWTLLRDRSDDVFARLAGVPPSGSQPGGFPVSGSPQEQLSQFGRQRARRRQVGARRQTEPRRRW